jgi:hypothetical protein
MKKLILIGILGALTGISQAASVTITNPGFESPDLTTAGGNTWTNDLAPGGGWLNADNSTSNGGSFIEVIGGFSSEGTQHIGVAPAWGVGQDAGILFEANTRYTLLIAAGNRLNQSAAGNLTQYGFSDGVGGIHGSATFDAFANVAAGSFSDAPAFVFDVPAGSPLIGQPVIVGLASAGPGRSHFDNIRLDASAIPEPTTGLLAGLAGLMLLRRKR